MINNGIVWLPYVQWHIPIFSWSRDQIKKRKKWETSIIIWENMGIPLREHKKIGEKQEKPISLGCNTMSVKVLLRVTMKAYLPVSWDKETKVMSIINTRGEIDRWHLHILVGILHITAYFSVLLSWFSRLTFYCISFLMFVEMVTCIV